MDWRELVKGILGIAAIIGIPLFLIFLDWHQMVGFTLGIVWTGITVTIARTGKDDS